MPSIENLNPLDNESGSPKASETSDEIFRDQQGKTQAAVKAIKKAEARAKKKDSQLAKVIGRFLMTNSNTQVMILIARCLGHNIPAGFILGLLALVEPEAQEEFEKLIRGSVQLFTAPEQGNHVLAERQGEFDTGRLPKQVKQAIDVWAQDLLEFSLTQPVRLLATAVSPEGDIFASLSQLATFLLQQYLASENINAEYKGTHNFAELLLKNIFEKVREQMKNTKELEEGATD